MLKAADRATPPAQTASVQTPLWQQLQGAAALLLAVRAGRSMTAELERVPPHLRPGVQALGFHALRWLGRAEALRQQLASRPPPPEADALLCVALALASEVDESMYTEYTLVDQAVEAAKQGEETQHQASFINGCLRRFLRERAELLAVCERKPQAVWNHPQWWVDRVRKDHPDVWQSILQANNSRPPLTLRVNTRQTTRADYLLALQAAGIDAEPVGAQGILLAGGGAVTRLPGYADGHFSVQDAGAQLAAPLLLDGLRCTRRQNRAFAGAGRRRAAGPRHGCAALPAHHAEPGPLAIAGPHRGGRRRPARRLVGRSVV
jgi:16S rRNA (cytosine967-C5)-methyltransferase